MKRKRTDHRRDRRPYETPRLRNFGPVARLTELGRKPSYDGRKPDFGIGRIIS